MVDWLEPDRQASHHYTSRNLSYLVWSLVSVEIYNNNTLCVYSSHCTYDGKILLVFCLDFTNDFFPFYLSNWKVQDKVLIQKKTIFSTKLQSSWSAPGSPKLIFSIKIQFLGLPVHTCYVSFVCWSLLCSVSVHQRSPYLYDVYPCPLSCPADVCPCLGSDPDCTSP